VACRTLRERIPWWAKIAAKLVLARVPVSYRVWRRLSLFKLGAMDDPAYALSVFRNHYERTRPPPGFVALEIGPGDTLFSVLVARALGASRVYAIDVGRFARDDLAPYGAMSRFLRERGLAVPEAGDSRSVDELIARSGGVYGSDGLASLRGIPAASVDLVWSQAVLEHVRRRDFLEVQRELRRVLRPEGVASHRIDLTDHLQSGIDHLRFPDWFWENDLVARSGFYTNRLRFGEMLALFAGAGFTAEVLGAERWERPPVAREALAARFRSLPEDELLVSGFDVVLRCDAAR
jgi:SAM-dependent methyltransferase